MGEGSGNITVGIYMYKITLFLAIIWAWLCWGVGFYSKEWIWFLLSFIPYFFHTTFGHKLKSNNHKKN